MENYVWNYHGTIDRSEMTEAVPKEILCRDPVFREHVVAIERLVVDYFADHSGAQQLFVIIWNAPFSFYVHYKHVGGT